MLSAVVLAASISNVGNNPVVFPCKPGKVLTYKIKGQWEEGAGLSTVIKKTITWHTRFIRCSLSPTKAIAIVRGLPSDLEWYQPGTEPNTYAIIQTAKALYIQQIPYNSEIDLQKIKPDPDNQYIGFPVEVGNCAVRQNNHPDGAYCWEVDSIKHVADNQTWTITYGGLGGFVSMTIEPGVGITEFSFDHGGTIADLKARLESITTPKHAK